MSHKSILAQLRVAIAESRDKTLGVSIYIIQDLLGLTGRTVYTDATTICRRHSWAHRAENYTHRVWAERQDWIDQAERLGVPRQNILDLLLTMEET